MIKIKILGLGGFSNFFLMNYLNTIKIYVDKIIQSILSKIILFKILFNTLNLILLLDRLLLSDRNTFDIYRLIIGCIISLIIKINQIGW